MAGGRQGLAEPGDDPLHQVGAAGAAVLALGGGEAQAVVGVGDDLEAVVAAVEGRAEVYVDGGVRRGTDVLKALALGARAVLVGRPVFWALTTGGASGVERLLTALTEDLRLAMALCGAPSVAALTPDLIA